jgi:hypothetical protein
VQYLANLATSTLLGLLVAILAALLATRHARTGAPALAGTPLLATAPRGGRGSTRRTAGNSGGRGNGGNGTERGNRAAGTGRGATRKSGKVNGNGENGKGRKANGNGQKAAQSAPAPRAREAASNPTVNPVSGLARLVPGGLRDQVLAYLQQHPGKDFSPTQVANALGGRSSGAVGNALETLTKHGQVVKTSDQPRRFSVPQQHNGRARKANGTTPAPTATQRGKRQPGRTTKAANGTGRTTSATVRKAPTKANGNGRNGNGTRKGRRTTR